MWYDPLVRFWHKDKDYVDCYNLFAQTITYVIIIVVLLLLVCGCASTAHLTTKHNITLPEPPPRVQIKKKDNPPEPNTIYVDPPKILKPRETYQTPDAGGVVWSYKSQNTIDWGLKAQRHWIDTARSIVQDHNHDNDKPWWAFWR